MRHRLPLTCAVVALGAVALVGCGDDDDESADTTGAPTSSSDTTTAPVDTSPDIAEDEDPDDSMGTDEGDPCVYTEGIDAEAILGEPVADPESSGDVCTFAAADSSSTAELNIAVRIGAGAEAYQQQRDLLGADAEIPDLGDEAFNSGTWIHVLAGEGYIYVQGIPNPVGDTRLNIFDLEAAADQVLTNLG
jgi:hypothetical protein